DQPAADRSRRVRQERSPSLFIVHHRFIKGKHGDTDFIFIFTVGLLRRFHSLASNKAHVLADQSIRRFRGCFCRIYLRNNIMFYDRHYPSPASTIEEYAKCPAFSGYFENLQHYFIQKRTISLFYSHYSKTLTFLSIKFM